MPSMVACTTRLGVGAIDSRRLIRHDALVAWPTDIPASSYEELRQKLLSGQLRLGVAKDHAKNWWTMGDESKGRGIAAFFVWLPILIGIAVVAATIWTQNWRWLVAVPLGLLTMFFGSPMNPAKGMAVVFGVALAVAGWLSGWSSFVFSGIVVLIMYLQLQVYYSVGKRAFRRFLLTGGGDAFAKYWDARMVMLQDSITGETLSHELSDEEFREMLGSPALADG